MAELFLAFLTVFGAVIDPYLAFATNDSPRPDARLFGRVGVDVLQGVAGYKTARTGGRPLMILYAAVNVIMLLENLNGFGELERGGAFTDGAKLFDHDGDIHVRGTLKSASVDATCWTGAAARAYDEVNATLMASISADAAQLVALDHQSAAILTRQADQVKDAGDGLTTARLIVIAAIPIVAELQTIITLLEALASRVRAADAVTAAALMAKARSLRRVQMGVTLLFVGAAGGVLYDSLRILTDHSTVNAREVADVMSQYQAVARKAAGIAPKNLTGAATGPAVRSVDRVNPAQSTTSVLQGMALVQ